jgi:hypothetical protein
MRRAFAAFFAAAFFSLFLFMACDEASLTGGGNGGNDPEAERKWKDGVMSFSFNADGYCDIISLVVVDAADTSKVFAYDESDTLVGGKYSVSAGNITQDAKYHVLLIAGNKNGAVDRTLLYSGYAAVSLSKKEQNIPLPMTRIVIGADFVQNGGA